MDTPIDRSKVRELLDLTGGDPSFLEDLLRTYVEDTTRRLADLHDAALRGPPERVHRAAHGIKGSSSNVGAHAVASCCSEIERLARLGDMAGVRDALVRMDHAFQRVTDDVPAALLSR